MHITSILTAPRREIDGLVSHVLLEAGDPGASALTITWVEVAPGARQALHRHSPEQVYVLLSGKGRMRVADEERDVGPGELVLVPKRDHEHR